MGSGRGRADGGIDYWPEDGRAVCGKTKTAVPPGLPWGEPVGIAGAIALQQAVALQLTQIVAELVASIGMVGKLKGGEQDLMELSGARAPDSVAGVQKDFK